MIEEEQGNDWKNNNNINTNLENNSIDIFQVHFRNQMQK